MSTIKKQSQLVRQALEWIVERRRADPAARTALLLSEAGARFNLSPAEQEQLLALLGSTGTDSGKPGG